MTTTTKKPKKQNKAKAPSIVNPKELKAWLRGIQEFAPAGWTPTPEQWATVCEKIYALDETEVQYAEGPVYAADPVYVPQTPAYAPIEPVYSSLGSAAPSHEAVQSSGRLAVANSPTESGMIPVTSANNPLEGDYKSPF